MAIVELSVVPIGTAGTSVSDYVAAIHDVLAKEKDVTFTLTPMSTVIEGELNTLWPLLRRLHEVPFPHGAQRVYTTIKIDDRRDKLATMTGKIASVRNKTAKVRD
ncbi:MAG: MTH1187 family thiamine-binding protein [Bacillota bacterium]|nr:MTH1187 family thiamine-binding protein [Bacillota bacterium]MDW7682896.1 MTH1187 family thiamine-binding protein [Bacillota bacterium]